jgi:putative tricarboxylic transport membrane protein
MSGPPDGAPDAGPIEERSLFPQPASMRWPYRVAALAVLALGAFVAVNALGLRYYTSIGPGPGFFPFWLGLALCLLAAAMFAGTFVGRQDPVKGPFFASAGGYLRLGAVLLCLLAATLLFNWLGFCLTMFAVHLFLLYVVGRNRLALSLVLALIGSFGVYYVFTHWLTVQLPAGLLGV